MKKEDKAVIKRAQECLEKYKDRESDNIKRAEEAIKFRAGQQWPDAVRRDREDVSQEGGPRPCPVLDKTNQYVRQVINEERQNRAAIKIRPVDDYADPKTAEILNGIIRHIEDRSEAIEAYTTAGEHAIDGGFGYFRLLPEYCDHMSFEQDIRIKRIHNRFSVALGPHTEVDGSDAKEGLIWEDMSRDDFMKEFPKAKEVSFDSGDWADKDTIRVAEYMQIKQEPAQIHLMPDGSVLTDEDYKQGQELFPDIPPPVKSRETMINKVKWYKITAEEVLDEKELPGSYIPIVKVTGNELIMPDGKTRLSGMIEAMMDPQRLHNYAHAGFIENVALAPRAPWIAAEDQVEGFEQDYADANRKNISVLRYKPVSEDGQPLPPPQRIQPAGISPGWQQMLMNTEQGISGAVGMYGSSVGDFSQSAMNPAVSGVALTEQKTQGIIGNFHFLDNLSRSIQHCGRILLEWIPVYYDTERVVRIIGEDGSEEMAKINPEMPMAVNPELDEYEREIGQIYNLNVGKYDVTVSTGPSYTAKRQEAVEAQIQVLQARPELMNLIGDIVFKNMDWPGAEQISERMKALLPPEIRDMEAQEGEVDPQVQAMMQQIEVMTQGLEQKAMELQQMEQQVMAEAAKNDSDNVKLSAMKKELAAERKAFMAEVKAEIADIQLTGEKLNNDILNATDDLVNELKLRSEPKEMPGTEEESIVEEEREMARDIAIQAALQNLAEYQAQSSEAIAQGINASLERITQLVAQPRITEIQYDEKGNPIGSISRGG